MTRPFWLTSPCPTWCQGDHAPETPLADAVHMTRTEEQFPLTTDTGRFVSYRGADGTVCSWQLPTEVLVYGQRHHLEAAPSVLLTINPECPTPDAPMREVRLTVAEARRLASALLQLADDLDSDDVETE